MKQKIILFDLDGTVANLYGRENWLDDLRNERLIYEYLEPLVDIIKLNEICYKLKECGFRFGVVTWLAMDCTKEYELLTSFEKYRWCKNKMPFIDTFEAQPYGTNKHINYKHSKAILIDDNTEVRKSFETNRNRKTIDATKNILEELQKILDKVQNI